MDFLLYSFYLLFGMILITPFLLFHYKFDELQSPFGRDKNEHLLPFLQKKSNLLDTLKDLRSDFHSGKISEEEFQSNSIPFLQELDEIEAQLSQLPDKNLIQTLSPVKVSAEWKCDNCGSYISLPKAKFCPECGNSRLA
ncbi:MAG: zinc ribbon domain-containing protein [Leptospira sp.]|nr:zinc ribbon domain-containing protein [Leptospira sp.]